LMQPCSPKNSSKSYTASPPRVFGGVPKKVVLIDNYFYRPLTVPIYTPKLKTPS